MEEKVQKGRGIYRFVLWTAVGAFALSALMTVMMILFTDFDSRTQSRLFWRVAFITWQTIWFGGLSILFANRYDKNPLPLAKVVSLLGILLALVLLLVGVGQALEIYATGEIGEKIKTILSIFLYSTLFAQLELLISRPISAVVMSRNITVGVIGMFDVIAAILIAIDYASTDAMMARLLAVFVIVALVGLIITAILNSLHKEQLPAEKQMVGENGGPVFVEPKAAKPIEPKKD